MSKQSSIQKELTVWCSTSPVHIIDGHAGYKQSKRHSEVEFIAHIESLGWLYEYKWNTWLCPACAKAADHG